MFLIRQLVDFSLVIFKGNFRPFCMISVELSFAYYLFVTRFRFLKLIKISICTVGTMI